MDWQGRMPGRGEVRRSWRTPYTDSSARDSPARALDARLATAACVRRPWIMHDTQPYVAETDGVIVRVRPSYLAGQSDPDDGPLGLGLSGRDREPGPGGRAADGAALDHHRRHAAMSRGARAGRGRRTAPDRAGRQLFLRLGLSAADAVGIDGGGLYDDRRQRPVFEAAIPAFSLDVPGGAGAELEAPSSAARRRSAKRGWGAASTRITAAPPRSRRLRRADATDGGKRQTAGRTALKQRAPRRER